ncbi:JAB N-terminal domain-containing protein [Streptomyces sp. NPDC053069]|uniref:JAB N-terminal domain-containing protein n=1 Tax=Streptomyces sp. NPDC053069 TaxID=3365695 RepID=UPI0037D788D0
MSEENRAGTAMVLLYKGTSFDLVGKMTLSSLMVEGLRRDLPDSEPDEPLIMHLRYVRKPDPRLVDGPRTIHNLRSQIGRLGVIVSQGGETVIDREYPVRELLGPVLQHVVQQLDADEQVWGFCIDHPSLSGLALGRSTPEVEGTMDLNLRESRRSFTVRKVAEPPVPGVDPADLGIDAAGLGQVTVLLSGDIHGHLQEMKLSRRLEEGGFLLGKVLRVLGPERTEGADDDGEAPADRYLVEITEVTPAEHAGAGALHFTFTGDSFREVNQRITASGQDRQLMGWYHTHLFSGNESGLSSIDVDLHLGTFRQPWQVAGLINLTSEERLLRFYARSGDSVRECEQWVKDDRGRYRLARAVVVDGR